MVDDMQQNVASGPVYTLPEVARELRVGRSTVLRWIQSGRLRAVRFGPTGRYRITLDALAEFLEHTPPMEETAS